jgi:pimeloyl-ACP methyl ester carboxylesterase
MLFVIMSCTEKKKNKIVISKTDTNIYVLVHEVWMGGWQWKGVVPFLESKGNSVLTPDLPGHGADKTPMDNITMDGYIEALLHIIDQQKKPVVLVGHGFNAITVSRVAELRPEKVKCLVFLAGVIPENKKPYAEMTRQFKEFTGVQHFLISKKKEQLKETLMHDVEDEVFQSAIKKMRTEPMVPLQYKLEVTKSKYGSVPKYYIQCQEDKLIPLRSQIQMYFNRVHVVKGLNAGHMPNFSKPKELAEIVMDFGTR